MTRRLAFVDVGARAGISPEAERHRDRILPVLFEPEPMEFAVLNAKSNGGELYRVLDQPLAHIDGDIEFHAAYNPACSSILKVNNDFLDQYDIAKGFREVTRLQMKCIRYDTAYREHNLPLPHMIKIDVQGFEYQVLQGFGGLLQHCLAVQCETHFYPIYKDQKLMHNIVELLAGYDMILRKIDCSRPGGLAGDMHFGMDVVEADITFTKTLSWAAQQDQQTRDDLNFACEIMGVVANR